MKTIIISLRMCLAFQLQQQRHGVCDSHFLYEVFKEDGFLSQGIVNQPFRKEDHPVREIVLREPRHDALLLHVRPTGNVDD